MSKLAPIAPQFVSAEPRTLVFKENRASLTGDSGKVKDTDGNLVFEIAAKKLSLSDRRVMKDASGKEMGQLRKKKLAFPYAAVYIGDTSDEKKCTVKKKGLTDITKCDADIYLGDTVIGECKGNWRAKTFTVIIDGKQAAEVKRETGVAGHLLDADNYIIQIAAGIDAAFMTLVIVALDELYHDED